MDILIKNMEQVEGCYYCPFLKGKANNFCIITGSKVRIEDVREKYEDERMADCPLVALPEHGDLIDRKALSDAIGKVITDRDRMIGTYDTIEQIIEGAETIVEATE